jgi:hypothetical protein
MLLLVLALFFCQFIFGQSLISGNVIKENKKPFPGVKVYVDGNESISAVTDNLGNFDIDVPLTAKILVFSYEGMKIQKIGIGNKNYISVTMKELDASDTAKTNKPKTDKPKEQPKKDDKIKDKSEKIKDTSDSTKVKKDTGKVKTDKDKPKEETKDKKDKTKGKTEEPKTDKEDNKDKTKDKGKKK